MRLRTIEPVWKDHPLYEALEMEGKSVEKVEFGFLPEKSNAHQSEIIRIRFTNGEILELTIGTNLDEFRDRINIAKVKTDFILSWKNS